MDEVRYCEYKFLLDAQRFRTPDDFKDFWRRAATVASRCNVETDSEIADKTPGIRSVAFYDTPGFDLYRNAFILRRRTEAKQSSSAELTFKFRHPDVEKSRRAEICAKSDLNPDVKFKEEVLQPRDGSCGSRSVFSHNCVLQASGPDVPRQMGELADLFPGVPNMGVARDTPVALVNGRTIEEHQIETNILAFGHGLSAKSSIAIWYEHDTGQPLIGEFSYQTKFDSPSKVDIRAKDRAEHLHFKLQRLLTGWVSAGATKTSLIYGSGVGHD